MVLKQLDYTGTLLILNFIGNIKHRMMRFGYVMAVNVTIMSVNFQMNLWGLSKVMLQLI